MEAFLPKSFKVSEIYCFLRDTVQPGSSSYHDPNPKIHNLELITNERLALEFYIKSTNQKWIQVESDKSSLLYYMIPNMRTNKFYNLQDICKIFHIDAEPASFLSHLEYTGLNRTFFESCSTSGEHNEQIYVGASSLSDSNYRDKYKWIYSDGSRVADVENGNFSRSDLWSMAFRQSENDTSKIFRQLLLKPIWSNEAPTLKLAAVAADNQAALHKWLACELRYPSIKPQKPEPNSPNFLDFRASLLEKSWLEVAKPPGEYLFYKVIRGFAGVLQTSCFEEHPLATLGQILDHETEFHVATDELIRYDYYLANSRIYEKK